MNRIIERVEIRIANPTDDPNTNARIEDGVRRALGFFPGARYSRQNVEMQMAQARRVRDVGAVAFDLTFGRQGGLDLIFVVTIAETGAEEGRGMAFGGEFPVLYDKDGSFLRARLDSLGLYYANNNAWYGRPDLMLAGNPLVEGEPSGEGYEHWLEGYVHYGLYGITPVGPDLYVFGGLSAITSGSAGQELFTDETRAYTGVEDAYIGLTGGRTSGDGDRLGYTFSLGRQRYTLANGFLIANTAANGQERAALQANARWSSDFLALARVTRNRLSGELFYLDPDELPVLDSETKYVGFNIEYDLQPGLTVALSHVAAPHSGAQYFGPTGTPVGGRDGLRVWDARFYYAVNGLGAPGWFFGAEYARQTNAHFDMDARAGWVEVGYVFNGPSWAPTISYRYSHFTGDDPDTATLERWDPMLSGGTGEQWVQGANHFKVVQDSNVIAHRLMGRFRAAPRVEILPQLWAFYADSETNIGGNPALSFLSDDEYGFEANITGKWLVSRRTYVHGHIAHTWPGDGADAALSGDAKDWSSVMLFLRYGY